MPIKFNGKTSKFTMVIMEADANPPYDNCTVQMIVPPGYNLQTIHPYLEFDTEQLLKQYIINHNMKSFDI